MCRTLKDLVNNKHVHIGYMSLQINSCDTVENKLNNYFIKSVTDIVSTIPSSNQEAITTAGPLEEDFWRFKEISFNKLRKTVFQLKKKSTGDEALTCSLVKQLIDVIGYPLLNIVNTPFRTGKTPSLLKRSIIVPVPKTNNPRKPEDLRPINLMPVIEKVIEIQCMNS
ncbi:unnamed protein product [Acanthoscelides obtectus]|uniref:Uncharacterized protein n=1 Tax=Acanthoscelides obtectus TaxID=200917 RepID=A0A9P0JME9_ACAOB|nr:unnamed protein product [Acanthoscelides obtectus]CAK1667051.1 hypothetical protein AOBTE_LOCUS25644 [Acanthoscelides obtectus]